MKMMISATTIATASPVSVPPPLSCRSLPSLRTIGRKAIGVGGQRPLKDEPAHAAPGAPTKCGRAWCVGHGLEVLAHSGMLRWLLGRVWFGRLGAIGGLHP